VGWACVGTALVGTARSGHQRQRSHDVSSVSGRVLTSRDTVTVPPRYLPVTQDRTQHSGSGQQHPARAKLSRREARDAARRTILDAARATLDEGGYEALTIDRVMTKAGLSRTIFYRHFDDRGGLLLDLWRQCMTTLTEVGWLVGDADADLPISLRANIDVVAAQAAVFIAVCDEATSDPDVREAYDASFQTFAGAIEEQIRSRFPHVRDAGGTAEALVAMNERLWYRRFRASTAPEVVDDTYRLTLDIWERVLSTD